MTRSCGRCGEPPADEYIALCERCGWPGRCPETARDGRRCTLPRGHWTDNEPLGLPCRFKEAA